MTPLGLILRRQGYSVLNYGYRSRHSTILEHAQSLAQFLESRGLQGKDLNFVAHSLGGIVARQLAHDFPDTFKYQRLVMMGSPNQGSTLAGKVMRAGFLSRLLGPALADLSSLKLPLQSAFSQIGVIAGGTTKDKGFNRLLPGDNDGIVTVAEASFPGAKDSVVILGLHSFLMYNPKAIREALHFLKYGEFTKTREKQTLTP
jgi:pimeloyl-ACP methyl ester carboxylesterase